MYVKSQREKLGSLSAGMQAIIAAAKADGNRGLTSDEATRFDAMEVDYSATEKSIERAERSEKRESDLRSVAGKEQVIELFHTDAKSDKDKAKDLHERGFSNYMRQGASKLTSEEQSFLNTTSTTTGSQGGYLVPQGFSGQLEKAMKWFGGMESAGEFTTETGNVLPWPTSNDTGNRGRIIGQNTQVTNTDPVFGQLSFGAYIFSSDSVLLPLALIQDSYFDLNAFVADALGTRIGRNKNLKMTVGAGSGSGEPNGIVTAAVAAGNTVTAATGQATSFTSFDEFVNVEHAIDPDYRPQSKYMMHDLTLKSLKKLKDSQNRPLWLPQAQAGAVSAFPQTINGYPVVINSDMATMAANADSVLFGDLKKYMVRKVAGETTVLRLVERYADFLQVGYIAFTRMDGQLLDAGTHPVAVLINSAT